MLGCKRVWIYGGSVEDHKKGNVIKVYQGDDLSGIRLLAFQVLSQDDGTPLSLHYPYQLHFIIKRDVEHEDANAILDVTGVFGSFSALGVVEFEILGAVTATLPVGQYVYDIEFTEGKLANPTYFTILRSHFVVLQP